MSGGVLKGLRVIDLTAVVVGPVSTLLLADYGADVIKIEPPKGDLLRKLGGGSNSGQLAPKFLHFNRNKRSVAIDLKTPAGRAVLERLLATADVCVSNMRPAAMKRLGLDVDALHRLNPSIIYCGLVGFGEGGRYRGKPAYDSIIQGIGGISAAFERSSGEPRFVPMTLADHLVGLIASQMILLALLDRKQTGKGQAIEVPMFENVAAFVLSEHMGQHTFTPPRGPSGDERLLDPGSQPIPTKDGYICVAPNTDAQAFGFFEAIGRPELKTDSRFSSVKARYENVGVYFQVRKESLRDRATEEWLELFDRYDVPAAAYHTFESLMDDKHLEDVGLFQKIAHPSEGAIIDIALPNHSSASARTDYLPPPLLGAHTREVLLEIGLNEAEIEAMFDSGEALEPVSA